MARVHYLQSSFTAGVLSPKLHARTDIKQYFQGLSIGRNVLIVPLGGVKRRPGLRYVMDLPAQLTRITAGITATAPNGGTAANANDNDETTFVVTTTNIGVLNPYVVVHYDLGSQKTIQFVDAVGLSITAGTSSQFRIQYSLDNAVWFEFLRAGSGAAEFPVVDTTPRTYRSGSPVAAAAVPARYLRVVRVGATDLGTAKASIAEFSIWQSTASVSEVRLLPFERSTDERFVVAPTDRNAVIAKDGVIVDTVRTPYATADLAELDGAQSADTMIVVHEDYAPRRLVREDATNWQLDAVVFTGIPKYDFADSLSPTPTSEIQTITFTNFVEGNTFQLELEGARTGPIGYSSSTATTAENIRREVQKLHTVGFTGVSCVFTAGTTYTITFADESADSLDLIVGTPLTAGATAAITAAETQNGSPRREDVWSDTRGWPRTVTFHEGRLWFGGSRSLPQAYFGSVVNDFFNFEVGEGLADDAIFGLLNTAQLNAVTALKSGRFLQLFTSGGEFRFTSSPITPSDVPRNQTEYGAAQIKPVATDGATVYIQKTRKVLRDFLYRYEEDAYSSFPLSALASHLFNNVVDISAWQGSGDDDANYVHIVNGDGTIVVYCTLRSQEIAAFSQWTTEGLFKATTVVGEDRYFAARRTLNGTDRLLLELADEAFYTDCAAQQSSNFSGFLVGQNAEWAHLNGEELRVRADGFVLSNNTPDVLGQMTLEYEPTTLVEAGLDWTPLATTMPLSSDFGNGDNFLRKKRVTKMRCLVYESLGVLYNGRPLADRYFDLNNFDEAPAPFTGAHSLEETSNWDEGPLTQSFSQADPLPFHLLGADFTVETS